jgi:hypothetical protein
MNESASIIDQTAFGMAASDHLAFLDGSGFDKEPYAGYLAFEKFANENPEATDFPEDFCPWSQHEGFSAQEIHYFIQSQAAVLKNTFHDILSLTKQGIVSAAINDEIPQDMNDLNLEEAANRGHRESQIEALQNELSQLQAIKTDHRKVLTDLQKRRYEELVGKLRDRGIEIPFNVEL